MRVAILGAGIAGLTVAHSLKRGSARGGAKLEVEVFEAGPRAGGCIRTTESSGFLIEWAADAFQTGPGPARALVEELGLGTARVEASADSARRYVFSRGRLHRFPSGPLALLRFAALTPAGRMRLLAEPFVAGRIAREESVHEFASRHIGKEAARVMLGAFVRGVYAGDAEKLSVDAAFPSMRELERKHRSLVVAMANGRREGRAAPQALWSLARGMGSLTDRLAQSLGSALKLRMPALRLSRVPEYAATTPFTIRFASGDTQSFDQVVVATPAADAAALLRDLDIEAANELRDIPAAGVAVVALALRREAFRSKPDGYGFLVAPGEEVPALGALFESNLFPGRAPEGYVLARIFLGGVDRPDLVSLPEAKLIGLACEALDRTLGLKGGPERTWVMRQEGAIPQYTLGHRERIASVMKRMGLFPGLYLAGSSYRGVSMGSIVEDADRVAGWILHAAR
ncbi:MAG TPA: protoporphyrinogen oxidase [Candidatus Limnocylindrales bacterium]|nr:protoporphyrinogen oxidase [Candidatus Limnocylindrales bacterium]